MSIESFDGERNVKVTPKEKAQELLMQAMQVAFNTLSDGGISTIDAMTEREKMIVRDQMDKQMQRVEKLFGFVPGSYGRGV